MMEADTGDYECWAQAESATAQQVKKILKVLVEAAGASVDAQTDEKSTPMRCAAMKGHAEALKVLDIAALKVEL